MPLLPGKSNIGFNIKEMQAAGHPHNQAVAASLNKVFGKKKAKKAKKQPSPKLQSY